MSIVAERPVRVQGGTRQVSAGLAEEIERQEREDNARGPEPEGVVPDRLMSSSYVRPRVLVGRRPDVRMSQEHAERLARLFDLHGARLVRYLAGRLGWDRYALAEDLAQEVWLELAARPDQMEGWERADEMAFGLLAFRGKRAIGTHFALARNTRERVLGAGVGGEDRSVESRLEALAGPVGDDPQCVVPELLEDMDEVPQAWGGCYADAIAALPLRQRQALELCCVEGMTREAIAARMGWSVSTAQSTLRRAFAALKDPQTMAMQQARRAADALPAEYERVLARLPERQREVVRLRAGGMTNAQASRHLGRNESATLQLYRRAAANVRQMVQERRKDPVTPAAPAVPQEKAGSGCSRVCMSGCYLRTVAS